MLRKRVIPILQLNDEKLVKSIKFKSHKYVGDPINAVRIFNEKQVDEIALIDIAKSKKKEDLNYEIIRDIADECRMPFAYGGGISNINQVEKLFSIGVEKIILNTSLLNNYNFINELAKEYGSQSIMVAVDINLNFFSKKKLYSWTKRKNLKTDVNKHIKNCINYGAGEILINSVYNEGTLTGFDFSLFDFLDLKVSVPIILNGGINSVKEINKILKKPEIDAVGIGAMFIYYGPHRAVLISYISNKERN